MVRGKVEIMQFIKFGIVGFSNTVIGYAIYVVTLYILRALGMFANADIYIAQFVEFVLSVAWAFYWQNKVVFVGKQDQKGNYFRALVKTYCSYAITGLFLSEALLVLWVKYLGINEYFAPALNLIITIPLNFVIQKYWAFQDKK